METLIKADDARKYLDYDPATGVMRWKIWPRTGRPSGREVLTTNAQGYRVVVLMGRQYRVHRVAWLMMYGKWPPELLDHVNGNRTDNRLVNLREATRAENNRNRGMSGNNTSGFKGVTYNKDRNKWQAKIWRNNKAIHLGRYPSAQGAFAAYCKASREYHGEFRRLV